MMETVILTQVTMYISMDISIGIYAYVILYRCAIYRYIDILYKFIFWSVSLHLIFSNYLKALQSAAAPLAA